MVNLKHKIPVIGQRSNCKGLSQMTAHIHAALMAQYAQDALTTDTPWDLWEWYSQTQEKWCPSSVTPLWTPAVQYRRKQEKWWYRVAFFKDAAKKHCWTYSAESNQEQCVENNIYFCRWLTDRVYYDVE